MLEIKGDVFRLRARSVHFVGHLPGVTAAFSLEGLWQAGQAATESLPAQHREFNPRGLLPMISAVLI